MKKYKMPKTSVWHHVKSIQLNNKKRAILQSRRGGSSMRKQKSEEMAREEACKIAKLINFSTSLPLIVSSLYWAEGHKKAFTFTNTDPNMVKVFLFGMNKYFGIRKIQWSLLIRITRDNNRHRVIRYWNHITGIPTQNIKVNVDIKQNKSRAINGICRIALRKGGYQLKIIHALIRTMIDSFA